jgi:trehalose synthase
VFSRDAFAWEGLPAERVAVIQPSIDAFSPKNAEQTRAILARAGIVPDGATCDACFLRADGTPGRVDRQATIVQDHSLTPADRVVMQISRWDALKDPLGVLGAFAEHVPDAHLVLAGPSTEAVADDPEGVRDPRHGDRSLG